MEISKHLILPVFFLTAMTLCSCGPLGVIPLAGAAAGSSAPASGGEPPVVIDENAIDLFDYGESYRNFYPIEVKPGDWFGASFEICKQGDGPCGQFEVYFYISADMEISHSDYFLGSDMIESYRDFSPVMLKGGDWFSVWCVVGNAGNGESGDFEVHFYASSDSVITNSDFYIGTRWMSSIPGGSYAYCDWGDYFPAAIGPGDYYIGWIIDSWGMESELDAWNNVAYKEDCLLTVIEADYDDLHEEDDSMADADAMGNFSERTWFSGVCGDYDWYRIHVTPKYTRVLVDLRFLHSECDIDLVLYNEYGDPLAYSTSVTDDEYIDIDVGSGGTYYICVYPCWSVAGVNYDLWWDDIRP
jgi:hypothetical protein